MHHLFCSFCRFNLLIDPFSSINFYFARYDSVFDHVKYLQICAHNKMIIQVEPYNEMKAQAAAHRHEENSLRVLLVMKAQALIKL